MSTISKYDGPVEVLEQNMYLSNLMMRRAEKERESDDFLQRVRTSVFRIQNYEAATGGRIPWSESPEAKEMQKLVLEAHRKKKQ